jgi:hypothetical protein
MSGFCIIKFSEYRTRLIDSLGKLGYEADWRILKLLISVCLNCGLGSSWSP